MDGGYFGSDRQMQLQRMVFERQNWIASTPGLVNAVRFLSIDDPERVGLDQITRYLDEFGLLAFRCLSKHQADLWFPKLEKLGYRMDQWDVFGARVQDVPTIVASIAGQALPDQLRLRPSLSDPDSLETRALQVFLSEQGIAPFSGSYLLDGPRQSTIVIEDELGQIVAAGNTYFPHNRFSPMHNHACVGLIAVSPLKRGLGLGKAVTARLVLRAQEMAAAAVYGLASRANAGSRRMLAACGLEWQPDLVCGLATPTAEQRFTT